MIAPCLVLMISCVWWRGSLGKGGLPMEISDVLQLLILMVAVAALAYKIGRK